MKTKLSFPLTVMTLSFTFLTAVSASGCGSSVKMLPKTVTAEFTVNSDSARFTNLFSDLLGKDRYEFSNKIDSAFQQLFYGDDKDQRIYFPAGDDMAYIEDINNSDVRTEGMSYGMMIAVQLDKKNEFDRLWKWAKTYMQHHSGPRSGYFAWHCKTNGEKISDGPASDGEEWFVTALFFAANRWGAGEGIFNYRKEAQNILDAMLSKTEFSDDQHIVTNMFNRQWKQVVFVPDGRGDDFTDPSYHLPHFYELWSQWADKENDFWSAAVDSSRKLLMKSVHEKTGLAPDYSRFDGTPYAPWGGGHDNFQFDAWRVAMNIAVDYEWFAKYDPVWKKEYEAQSDRMLNFFYSEGIETYGNVFSLDGGKSDGDHSTGLVAANAVAALSATVEFRKDFVEQLWIAKIPQGRYRYYDGMLYLLGLLQASGNFRIY